MMMMMNSSTDNKMTTSEETETETTRANFLIDQQQTETETSINILNDDILDRIFQYLYFDDKIRLRETCFRWKYLLENQLDKMKALRLGRFIQGGYNVTSGLNFPTKCQHNHHYVDKMRQNNKQQQQHQSFQQSHRLITGQLFSDNFLAFPADLETQCFSVNRYDYLHRALKYRYLNITMLSLGQLNITYRLLMVIAHNLPNLEHLEIINCASRLDIGRRHETTTTSSESDLKKRNSPSEQQRKRETETEIISGNHQYSDHQTLSHRNIGSYRNRRESLEEQQQQQQQQIPTLERFNSFMMEQQSDLYRNQLLYNQHSDEQQNMQERLLRSSLLKNCDLVRESKRYTYWPHLEHLLVKECNLLNEFSLCLVVSITSKTLTHLVVESNQYLTGEFLNYCGPKLQQLRLNNCPMIRTKFLDDLVKLKQLLSPPDQQQQQQQQQRQQPIGSSFDYKQNNSNLIVF